MLLVLGWAMRKSKPVYVVIKSGWESTEIVRVYEKKEDAERYCQSANTQAKSSYGNPYSYERVSYIHEA